MSLITVGVAEIENKQSIGMANLLRHSAFIYIAFFVSLGHPILFDADVWSGNEPFKETLFSIYAAGRIAFIWASCLLCSAYIAIFAVYLMKKRIDEHSIALMWSMFAAYAGWFIWAAYLKA